MSRWDHSLGSCFHNAITKMRSRYCSKVSMLYHNEFSVLPQYNGLDAISISCHHSSCYHSLGAAIRTRYYHYNEVSMLRQVISAITVMLQQFIHVDAMMDGGSLESRLLGPWSSHLWIYWRKNLWLGFPHPRGGFFPSNVPISCVLFFCCLALILMIKKDN